MFIDFIKDQTHKNQLMKSVYQYIYQNGPISKAELQQKTKLKLTTLARIIDEMLNCQFIRTSGLGKSETPGRPPVLYHINETVGYIVGIHITRLRTKVMLFDLYFQPLEKKSFSVISHNYDTILLDKVIRTIRDFMRKRAISINQLIGIGIGSIGPIDRKEGVITLNPDDQVYSEWANVPIVDVLSRHFPVRIHLENGPNTAALGEYKFSSFQSHQNLLYCVSGWGVGCGVLTNGEITGGQQGDVYAFGHMIIDVDGKPCTCGKHGCLNSYISISSIIRELQRNNLFKSIDITKMQQEAVIDLLVREEVATREIVLDSAYYYGVGIANMVNVLHTKQVILNGVLIYEYPGYYQKVVQIAKSHLYRNDGVVFSQGILKENAPIIGAAILVFESYFSNHFIQFNNRDVNKDFESNSILM